MTKNRITALIGRCCGENEKQEGQRLAVNVTGYGEKENNKENIVMSTSFLLCETVVGVDHWSRRLVVHRARALGGIPQTP